MGSITETPTFEESIYLIQETDPVLGGEDGTVNIQPKQLTNRTAYLKAMLAVQHLGNGQHSITNEMVSPTAGISEAKLALDYDTAGLYADAQANLEKINYLEETIDNIAGSDGTAIGALGRAVPLSWEYSEYGFEFELFASTLIMRNIPDTTVIGTVSGDESVDCGTTSNLRLNEYYVICDEDGSNSEIIQVDEILNGQRFRCAAPLAHTRTSGRLGHTSWVVKAGSAEAKNNTSFVSRTLDVNKMYNDGKLIIRRDTSAAYFNVYWKETGSDTWEACQFLQSVVREKNYKDDEFKIPGGTGKLRVDVKGVAADKVLTVDHLVVFPFGNIVALDYVQKPVNTTPAEGAVNVSTGNTLQGSEYRSLYGETHGSSVFQIASDAAFTDVLMEKTVAGPATSTTINAAVLEVNSNYFWRHKYVDSLGNTSSWSNPTQFSTSNVFASVSTPVVLSPSFGSVVDVSDYLSIVTNSFSMSIGTGTHVSTDWVISDTADFSNVVYSSLADTLNKTQITFADTSELVGNTLYYARVRHKAEISGGSFATSQWSSPVSFSISLQYAGTVIGVVMVAQGGNGGTWARIDGAFNTVDIDSAYFDSHPVFSGMVDEVIDGQNMVKIPKFYYKVGTVPSGEHAGKTYWLISDQLETGFAVHPAFMNYGTELSRVYVGKYQASSDGSKMRSIPGVLPAVDKSLATFQSEATARNVSGVTGFMQWSMYQLGAIQMLYLIENATMDSQAKTGVGHTLNTPLSLLNVAHSTVAEATYRGIVGLWGNIDSYVDGILTESGVVKLWDLQGNKTYITTTVSGFASNALKANTFNTLTTANYSFSAIFVMKTGVEYTVENLATCPDQVTFPNSGSYPVLTGGYHARNIGAGLWMFVVNTSEGGSIYGTRLAKV